MAGLMRDTKTGRGGLRTKRRHELAVRTTISVPPLVMHMGVEGEKDGAFGSFSNYVADLIRRDREHRLMRQLQLPLHG